MLGFIYNRNKQCGCKCYQSSPDDDDWGSEQSNVEARMEVIFFGLEQLKEDKKFTNGRPAFVEERKEKTAATGMRVVLCRRAVRTMGWCGGSG